jgi:hypothetical protein
MSARDVIAQSLRNNRVADAHLTTSRILFALEDEGYRLIGPGELDPETIERCVEVAQAAKGKKFGFEPYQHLIASPDDIADALRSLQGGEDAV